MLPIDSQATGAPQRPDGAHDKLGGSRQVVRRASTAQEVTLTKGHHGAQLLSASAHETPFGPVVAHQVLVQTPLAVLQLQSQAKLSADGAPESVRALGRAELHTQYGNLLLRAQSNSWWTSSLPGYLASHVSAGSWASCSWLTDVFLPSLMRGQGVQGGCATQRQNHESTVTVPLQPRVRGSSRRRSSQPSSTRRGRREHQRPFQVVVVGEVKLAVGRSEEETRRPSPVSGRAAPDCASCAVAPRRRGPEQLLVVDGAARPTRPDPMIHTPHEPPLDFQ